MVKKTAHIKSLQITNENGKSRNMMNLKPVIKNLHCYECGRVFSNCESFKTHRHGSFKIKKEQTKGDEKEEKEDSTPIPKISTTTKNNQNNNNNISNNSIKSQDKNLKGQENNPIILNNNKNNNKTTIMSANKIQVSKSTKLNLTDKNKCKTNPSTTLTLTQQQEKLLNNILSSLNVNPSDLHDYFRCYKCNSSFHRLFDFIPHFKQCQSAAQVKTNVNIKIDIGQSKKYLDKEVQVQSLNSRITVSEAAKIQQQNFIKKSTPISFLPPRPSQLIVKENSPSEMEMEIDHNDDDYNNDNNYEPLPSISSPPPENEKEKESEKSLNKSNAESQAIKIKIEKPSTSTSTTTTSAKSKFKSYPPSILSCRQCDVPPFPTLALLNAHFSEKHGLRDQNVQNGFVCEICQSSFSTLFYLQQHLITHEEVRPILPVAEDGDSEFKYVTEEGLPTRAYLEAIKKDEKDIGNFKCLACDNIFVVKEKLYKHVLYHKKRKPDISCPWCSKVNPKNQISLERHIKRVHPDKFSGFHCHHDKCKGQPSFPTQELYDQHKLEQHSVLKGDFVCQICGITLKSTAILKTHLRRHETGKPLKCTFPNCNKSYKDSYALRNHELTHGEKLFKCTEDSCDKAFHTPYLLNVHIQCVHSQLKLYKCTFPNCDQSFSSYAKRKSHSYSHSTRIYKCTFQGCSSSFKKKQILRNHMLTHQGEKAKKFKCTYPDCGYKTIKKYQLQHHVQQVHEKIKRFLCNECGYSCFTGASYRVHLQSHSDLRPYKCDSCDLAFKIPFALTHHKKTHRDDRPLKCQYCDKAFKLRMVLKRHELTHTKFKPYQCAFCEMAYPDNRTLKHHVTKEHTDEYVFDLSKPASYQIYLIKSSRKQNQGPK